MKRTIGVRPNTDPPREDRYGEGYANGWVLGYEARRKKTEKILRSIAERDGSEYLLRVMKEVLQ